MEERGHLYGAKPRYTLAVGRIAPGGGPAQRSRQEMCSGGDIGGGRLIWSTTVAGLGAAQHGWVGAGSLPVLFTHGVKPMGAF